MAGRTGREREREREREMIITLHPAIYSADIIVIKTDIKLITV